MPRKSVKLLAQEEVDKENEADPKEECNSPQTNTPRAGKKSKPAADKGVSDKAVKKKSLGAEKTDTPKQKSKKPLVENKKETPKRRKSKAKETILSDHETTPELPDADLSGGRNDKFPRIKLKITNGQIDRTTPTAVKSQKRTSVVLKEKNNATPTSSNERVKKTPLGKEPSGKQSSTKKETKSPLSKKKTEMGPASRTQRAPVNMPEVDKKRKSTDASAKDKKSSSSDEGACLKVPPISLSITKSPQKTIVSIKKSTDGKRPEIQVEIRKPASGDSRKIPDDSRAGESKKSEVSDLSDDGTSEGKGKLYDPMRTRKRAGFTLSQEECDIISGAKRSKHSPGKPITPPNISREEADRLSNVKVMLSPVHETAKKRKPANTLEAEFDKIDQELLAAPPKRKRTDKPEVKPSEKAKVSSPVVETKRQSVGRGKSSNTPPVLSKLKEKNVKKEDVLDKTESKTKSIVRNDAESRRKSKDKKENVIANGEVKENQVENKR